MPYGQQTDRYDRVAWRAGAAHFQAAARPIRQAMIEVEVWRVHRCSGMGAQTVNLHGEHYKNIADLMRLKDLCYPEHMLLNTYV